MGKRSRIVLGVMATCLTAACCLVACSGDDSEPQTGTDSGVDGQAADTASSDTYVPPHDGSADAADARDAHDAADADRAYVDNVNGCNASDYVDRSGSGDSRIVEAADSGAKAAYQPPCMKIAKGQSVTFRGDFTDHPLQPSTTPNPIPVTSSGSSVTVAFPNAGVYGYECAIPAHQTIMKAAIWVSP